MPGRIPNPSAVAGARTRPPGSGLLLLRRSSRPWKTHNNTVCEPREEKSWEKKKHLSTSVVLYCWNKIAWSLPNTEFKVAHNHFNKRITVNDCCCFLNLVEGSSAGYRKACPLSLARKGQIYPDSNISIHYFTNRQDSVLWDFFFFFPPLPQGVALTFFSTPPPTSGTFATRSRAPINPSTIVPKCSE